MNPGTMLIVESKKIEHVSITGPNIQEALEYCSSHRLAIQDISPQEIENEGVLFRINAVREVQLVEA